jgi:non-homologous end joining protein Ku
MKQRSSSAQAEGRVTPRPHNVVNIHEALKKSLAAESKRAKKR